MITRRQLEERLHTRERKVNFEALAQTLLHQQFPLTDLIDLAFHHIDEVAFRAAWLLELTFTIAPETYVDDIAYIVKRFPEITNDSCRRHFSKILIAITKPNASVNIVNKLKELDLEPVVETLFDWTIKPDGKIAVKVFSAELLLRLSNRYSWIKAELNEQVEFMMRDGSAGIQARGRKILRALEKEKYLQKD